ncbi:unnamed protein product [Rotaria sp. Silwood1]|nr:unnamed protein product [Rotaria sp. Silwood1]CAF4912737.1 unnamed protein product [Rotaria sp. Silwood1]
MATAVKHTSAADKTLDGMLLEMFHLVWLDAGSSSPDGRHTEQQLRSIINHLVKFQDVHECEEYIKAQSSNERIVMVVSGQLGRKIVPNIHLLRQVISIYVYCMDVVAHKIWTQNYRKVKGVVVELNELIKRIQADHKIQKKMEEPLSINIFTTNTLTEGVSTTGINNNFLFSQVFMDCLIRLKYTEADQKELIEFCKQKYKGNNFELSNIGEFQEHYSSENALRWYTRESFFYKTLNAALRQSDIHAIFLFRKYIADIQQQLKNRQVRNSIRIYRCQMISNNELETLRKSCGQFISINSFFSTSIYKDNALKFLKTPDDTENLASVLFEIDANPQMAITRPFAALGELSEYKDEAEVLFMIGSIFRLDKVKRNDINQVWIVRMILCNDEEHVLKEVLMDMKEKFVHDETNLLILGKFLWEMAKPNFAEKYYKRMLNQLSLDDPTLIDLYMELATTELQAGHQEESLKWRQKASELKKKLPLSSSFNNSKPKKSIGKLIKILSLFY